MVLNNLLFLLSFKILPYIKHLKNKNIWECFHGGYSHIYLKDLGFNVIQNKEDFFEMIKQNQQTSSIPVVLTGKEEKAPFLGLNIRKYFQKPFSPKELENSLREIIGDK